MIKLLRLGHATFETPAIEKAIEHHTQVIGLSLAGRDGKRAFLAARSAGLTRRRACRTRRSRQRPSGHRSDRRSNPGGEITNLRSLRR